MGASDDIFEWSPCHGHHHVKSYAKYELRDASGTVVVGRKQSFCLHDVQAIEPVTGAGYDCGFQGISAGWADVYNRNIPCQWIDATDLAPGTYTLNVEVNAARVLEESDVTNNSFSIDVTL
jgi:hypothetical protein